MTNFSLLIQLKSALQSVDSHFISRFNAGGHNQGTPIAPNKNEDLFFKRKTKKTKLSGFETDLAHMVQHERTT